MMRIAVYFLPSLLTGPPEAHGVSIAIDVLRATTTLTTILDCGATEVIAAPSLDGARVLKARDPGALLIGELAGLRPDDFDLGNSPREPTPALATGRRAICHTSNGTAAIRAVAGSHATLLGCVRNATAVATRAYALARTAEQPVTILCGGGGGGRAFALDDTLVAGYLALLIAALAARDGVATEQSDATLAACALFRSEVGTTPSPAAAWEAALGRTASGRNLVVLGLAEDVPFCAQPDRTATVPVARIVGEQVVIAAASAPDAA